MLRFLLVLTMLICLPPRALGQDAGPTPEAEPGTAPHHTHEGARGKFYQSWKQPQNRNYSCCNNEDCDVAQAHMENGHWVARFEGEENFTVIPDERIETERDSPDGFSHLCKRGRFSGATVLCFLPAGGG